MVSHPVVAALRRAYHLPLLAHLGALVVMVALAVPHLNLTTHAILDDEGAYAIQVQELRQGHWHYDYAGADFDPEGRWFPVVRSSSVEGRFYPYVQHPASVVVLYGSVSLFGEGVGFYLPSIVGLLLAAVAAWRLAGRVEQRAARPAFWLVAVSPLVVNAFVIWAHTLSAALAAFGLLLALAVLQEGSSPWAKLGLGACLAGGVVLRSEAVLFAIAVTLVVTGTLIWRGRHSHAALTVAICTTAVILAVIGEIAATRAITGGDGALGTLAFRGDPVSASSFLSDRWGGLWRVVFGSGYRKSAAEHAGGAPITTALVLLALAGLVLRARERSQDHMSRTLLAVPAIGAALLLYEIRFAGAPSHWLSGYFAAWPVLLLGLVATPWKRTTVPERALALIVALFAGAVVLTQYSIGGAAEWGGRFLSPTVVPIAVIAAIGLTRRLADYPWRQRGVLTAALAVLAVVLAAHGLLESRSFRGEFSHLYRDLREEAHEVVVVVDFSMWSVPKASWPLHQRFEWYLPRTAAEADQLFTELAEHGVENVSLFANGRLYQGRACPETSARRDQDSRSERRRDEMEGCLRVRHEQAGRGTGSPST